MKSFIRERKLPAFIVAAPRSSAGKTTITIGLIRALKKRGLKTRAFKSGPDYIDTGHLALASGGFAYNLDTWMMGEASCKRTFSTGIEGMDAGIIEGAMGLFDGKDGLYKEGSTGHLARTLGLPVLLLLDARGIGGTIAALAKGIAGFDRKIILIGVIINRVAGKRHEAIIREAFKRYTNLDVLGVIPEDQDLFLPSRHLGLVDAGDMDAKDWQAFAKKAGRFVERHVDMDALLSASVISAEKTPKALFRPSAKKRPRIAIALDRAFCFYYRENLELLKTLGAEIVFFSPMQDKRLPSDTKAVYLGGGYPELHAAQLSKNK
ncbi:MAG: cobyrinate a,c-diamide synthase, partial [Deltaproteobacteria bacterium]|nr:cobyrinate a,c-diamide synthase [Deltaproteobacteria bacterium]